MAVISVPPVAMPDENHPTQVLVGEDVRDVADVDLQADERVSQVGALTKGGERGGEHLMALRTQQRSDLLPTPPAMLGRVNQHERRH